MTRMIRNRIESSNTATWNMADMPARRFRAALTLLGLLLPTIGLSADEFPTEMDFAVVSYDSKEVPISDDAVILTFAAEGAAKLSIEGYGDAYFHLVCVGSETFSEGGPNYENWKDGKWTGFSHCVLRDHDKGDELRMKSSTDMQDYYFEFSGGTGRWKNAAGKLAMYIQHPYVKRRVDENVANRVYFVIYMDGKGKISL